MKSYFVRWRDIHDVVHWVTNERNGRVYTDCGILIGYRPRPTVHGTDGYKATRDPPSCLECVVGAEFELEGHRGP